MASVDGSKSLQGGLDEMREFDCGPCRKSYVKKEARHYCEECQEYLCNPCKDYHGKLTVTQNHKILSGDEMAKLSMEKHRPGYNVKCSCNLNKTVESFCEEHNDIICSSCESVKHRKCTTHPIQDKSAGYISTSLDSVLKKASTLNASIEKLTKERGIDKSRLKVLKETCQIDIRKFRRELNALNALLDK